MDFKNKIASFFNALFVNFHHIRPVQSVEKVVSRMNLTEKILFYSAALVFVASGLVLLSRANDLFLVEVPAFGGSFTEGVIGSPRFINPVLATSETDKDLSSLVYSGLLRSSEDGGYKPDLAESYFVSEDGLVYEFRIKDGAYFHDGKEVTADDIIFTVNKVLDPVMKSPRRIGWEGVTAEKLSENEVRFTLKKPYSPFLSALTLGILPKHIWENATSEEFPFSQFNINPIGAGPYKVEKLSRNSGGIPTSIVLSAWDRYALGQPKIKLITFRFFPNEDSLVKAYKNEDIESMVGFSQAAAALMPQNGSVINKLTLPRVFGVFFNQNLSPVLLNKEVRQALDMAAPKQRIVDEVLAGYGRVLNGPTPANAETDPAKAAGSAEGARAFLVDKGWTLNEETGVLEKKTKKEKTVLEFSITTSDTPELKKTAEILQEAWQNMGALVSIKVFESGDLSQNIIKSRKYDALLFGKVVEENGDLYPFWHSSGRVDPGLNISLYANLTVDKKLEGLQKETDPQKIKEDKKVIFTEIENDVPAVFLFSPYFLYVESPKIKNPVMKNISYQNERFAFIDSWYIETNKVWRFFNTND